MAYDEKLADRVRELVADRPMTEKQMFGGLSFLLAGNMAVGIHKDSLMVRVGSDEADAVLAEPDARIFDMGGRPMKNWVLVDQQVLADEADLRRWVDRGLAYAATFPPK